MVAIDDNGAPTEIPQLSPTMLGANPEAQRRQREANVRREGRLAERAAMVGGAGRQPGE
jgi:acyl-CoA hydrolase